MVAATGEPILPGATEHWSDTDYSSCFFLHVGNERGDWVIGGVTDADSSTNSVLIGHSPYGEFLIAREGDPLDLDGNGIFDDNTFINTFGNDDATFVNSRNLYIVVSIRDETGMINGNAFLLVSAPCTPVELVSFTIE